MISRRTLLSGVMTLGSLGLLEQAARLVAAKGYSYDYALQTMNEIRYARWNEYDPEDTVRFYSLRLREAGMIKSIPNKIIAQGTDWLVFNELKQELKS